MMPVQQDASRVYSGGLDNVLKVFDLNTGTGICSSSVQFTSLCVMNTFHCMLGMFI